MSSGFPTVPLVDQFLRGDATTIGGSGWNFYALTGSGDLGISSNQLYNPDGAASSCIAYRSETTGPDQEGYVTLATLPTSDGCDIVLRLSFTTAHNGYAVVWETTQVASIYRIDASVYTALGSGDIPLTLAVGDKLGGRVIGNRIEAYKCIGDTWSLAFARTDST